MIRSYLKNHFVIPCVDGNVVKWFSNVYGSVHLGIDISWWIGQHLSILAAQEGKVVDVSKTADPNVGHYIVLQHDYDDGTHAWTAYIHLYEAPNFKVGDAVKMNQVIGKKGNTGRSNGEHLHIYITKPVTVAYTWNNMRNNAVDPYPLIYKSKEAKYVYLGSHLVNKTFIEDVPEPIVYPEPVERNEDVKQVEVIMDVLRLRNGPGTNFDAYDELCKKGIFNVLREEFDSDKRYLWYEIEKGFWIASGGARTQDLLPKLSEEEILRARVQELEVENAKLNFSVMTLSEDNIKLKDILLESNEINSNLTKTNNDLVAKLDAIKEIVK